MSVQVPAEDVPAVQAIVRAAVRAHGPQPCLACGCAGPSTAAVVSWLMTVLGCTFDEAAEWWRVGTQHPQARVWACPADALHPLPGRRAGP